MASSPLAGTVSKGDPAAPDCSTCGKTGEKIDRMREREEWECSHVDCPNRRRCWSNGTGDPAWRPVKTVDPLAPLFDKVDD